ncbi:Nlrc3 [Symbiodinium natans]|uniref:Nlrc3 protein n=1 Tax=Symbiodinium natans TaxID=878477 RepID=A0A812JEX0_9DINO|nr:Nlrc3 [Symbiodinium natans]
MALPVATLLYMSCNLEDNAGDEGDEVSSLTTAAIQPSALTKLERNPIANFSDRSEEALKPRASNPIPTPHALPLSFSSERPHIHTQRRAPYLARGPGWLVFCAMPLRLAALSLLAAASASSCSKGLGEESSLLQRISLEGDEVKSEFQASEAQVQAAPLLVIHAGVHKTGTTATQFALKKCQTWAEHFGITSLVSKKEKAIANHNFLVHLSELAKSPVPRFKEAYDWHNEETFNETWAMLQKCEEAHHKGKPCKAVISSELFTEAALPVWKLFLQQLKGWNVRVFIMQRDYNSWLRALYGEYHRSYMLDTASNPMPLLEFITQGPGAFFSAESLLHRVKAAFQGLCGTKAGPLHCSVKGASYDHFLSQNRDQYEFLMLNLTMNLTGNEFNRVNQSLWKYCSKRSHSNPSAKNATVGVGIVRLLANDHIANGCTLPFKLTAFNGSILHLAQEGNMPTQCIDAKSLVKDDAERWFAVTEGTAPTTLESEPVCVLKERGMNAEAWKKLRYIAPPCRPSDLAQPQAGQQLHAGQQHSGQPWHAGKQWHAKQKDGKQQDGLSASSK